jgi:hypothetical protein
MAQAGNRSLRAALGCRGLYMFVMAVGVLSGCSGVTFERVSSSNPSPNGIRYFRPATYLLVKPDYEKQSAKLEWVTLPDTSDAFTAAPFAFMATNTTELEFKGGLLTKMDSDTDSSAVPKAAIKALDEIVKASIATAIAGVKASAAGFTVTRRDPGAVVGLPSQAIFLFKIEDGPGGSVVKQLYPPVPSSRAPGVR